MYTEEIKQQKKQEAKIVHNKPEGYNVSSRWERG